MNTLTRQILILTSALALLVPTLWAVGFGSAPLGVAGPEVSPAPVQQESFLTFVRQRQAVRWAKVPRKVLAFYYTWYGRPERHGRWVHWDRVRPEVHDIASSTNYPALGAYDSHDPEVIDHHIDLALSHGVNGFICTWWGQGTFDDRAFEQVLDRAEKKDFTVTLYWETAPGTGKAMVDRAVEDLHYMLERYGGHPAFLKVEGRPVIFVYGRVMGQVPMGAWQEIITRTEQQHPEGFLLIADGLSTANARLFDGIHTYNICGWVKDKPPEALAELSRDAFRRAVETAKAKGKISCITVIPGYDDTKIRKPGLKAGRMDGDTCRILWEEAISADPDWVLITSWNEWHEGSEIEPSREHGDRELKITAAHARRFKETPYSGHALPAAAAGLDPKKAKALQDRFKGATIAILPDYTSEAVFWLAGTGVAIAELTWEEVADPDVFKADRYPLAVYAGYEHYRRTVREEGDVDRALIAYLEGGGLLAALPSGPFPFYYDEAGRAVSSATRLGFPILGTGGTAKPTVGGWEEPPKGETLFFEIDKKQLDGLPARLAFPESGDLRWRPGTRSRLPEGDLYLPLARLVNEKGESFGDGIFYVEHRASPPRGGRNLYAWMGLTSGPALEDVLFALFMFAGKTRDGG